MGNLSPTAQAPALYPSILPWYTFITRKPPDYDSLTIFSWAKTRHPLGKAWAPPLLPLGDPLGIFKEIPQWSTLQSQWDFPQDTKGDLGLGTDRPLPRTLTLYHSNLPWNNFITCKSALTMIP